MEPALEHLPLAVLVVDEDGRVHEANAHARAVASDHRVERLEDLVSQALAARIQRDATPALARGLPWSAVGSLVDGSAVEVRVDPRGAALGRAVLTATPTESRSPHDRLLSRLVAHTPGVGQDFFEQLVVHLSGKLDTRFGMVATYADSSRTHLRSLALCDRGRLLEPVFYEVEGTPCAQVLAEGSSFYPDGVAELFPRDTRLRDKGIRGYMGVALLDRDGEALGLLVLMNDAPLHEPRPLQGFLSLFAARAATELLRVRAEQEARAQGAFVERLLDQVAALVLVLDRSGHVVRVNRVVTELLGFDEASVLGTCFRDGLLGRGACEPGWLDRLVTGAARVDDWACADGTRRRVRWQARAVDGAGGTHVLVTGVDLTDLESARRERDALQDQLRQAQRLESLGRLAGGVAHDFNNLLLAILGYADLIAEDPGSMDEVRTSAQQIRLASEQAAALTKQLLAFGRRVHLDRKVLDLRDVLDDATRVLRPVLAPRVRLDLQVPDRPLRVLADPGRLEQVVVNLAVNARDAMPDGGRLVLRLRELGPGDLPDGLATDQAVELEISDTGAGIPDEVLPHIFEPFFTTKELGRGTGLGLASVYGTVQQHGGVVQVRSELGAGTTFRIVLPLHTRPTTVERAPAGEVTGRLRGRVLVAEDEEHVRGLVSRVLRRAGLVVEAVEDGRQALAAFEREPDGYELVFADVVMPGLGGVELARRILASRPDQRLLLASGFVADVSDLPAEVRLLSKPYLPEELLQAVEVELGVARGASEA